MMWESILDLLGMGAETAAPAAGDAAATAAPFAADLATTAAPVAADAAGWGLSNIPWSSILGYTGSGLGLGMQGLGIANQLGAFRPDQPQMPNWQQMPGMQSQQGQGVDQSMIRRRLSDAQSQGLSGASPDFMAQLAGVTPNELTQMMGMGYSYDNSRGGR